MTDASDKDPEMGALLSSLHGSISSRQMNSGKEMVRSAIIAMHEKAVLKASGLLTRVQRP